MTALKHCAAHPQRPRLLTAVITSTRSEFMASFDGQHFLSRAQVRDVDGGVQVVKAQEPKRRTIIDSISVAVIGTGIIGKT